MGGVEHVLDLCRPCRSASAMVHASLHQGHHAGAENQPPSPWPASLSSHEYRKGRIVGRGTGWTVVTEGESLDGLDAALIQVSRPSLGLGSIAVGRPSERQTEIGQIGMLGGDSLEGADQVADGPARNRPL
jgi:hypothetical protein